MQDLITRKTTLPEHIIQLVRFLRKNDFNLGATEQADLLVAIKMELPRSFEVMEKYCKAILVKNQKQFFKFDKLYRQYWEELSKAEDAKFKDREEENQRRNNQGQQPPSLQMLKKWLYNGRVDEEKDIASYSAFEAVGKKDFSAFDSSSQKELLEILRIIAQKLINRYSRRFVKSRRTNQLDMGKTIRQALRKDISIDKFYFKERKKRKIGLVLLCDVSKSMELYSRFLIEFMFNFQQVVHDIHTFAFSTRLMPLRSLLKEKDVREALKNISEEVDHWSGGTQIGHSLQQFIDGYGSRLVKRNTVVMILSDGWDTGEVDELKSAMKFLHRKSEKVIWINPLAGNTGYVPETKGMLAALPFIDVFTSAHNLDSLKKIASHLKLKRLRPNQPSK